MAYRVHYRDLANHLSELDITATCADLAAKLRAYEHTDAEYRERLAEAVETLPPGACWIDGLVALCEALREDNPRFVPALMMEWCLEDI